MKLLHLFSIGVVMLLAVPLFAAEEAKERKDPKYWSVSFFETGSYQFYDTGKKDPGELDMFAGNEIGKEINAQLKWITLDVYIPIPKLPESIGLNGGADVSAYLDDEKEMWSWNVGLFARVSKFVRIEGGVVQVRSKAFGLDSSQRDDTALYVGVVTPTYAGDALGNLVEDRMGDLLGLVMGGE